MISIILFITVEIEISTGNPSSLNPGIPFFSLPVMMLEFFTLARSLLRDNICPSILNISSRLSLLDFSDVLTVLISFIKSFEASYELPWNLS